MKRILSAEELEKIRKNYCKRHGCKLPKLCNNIDELKSEVLRLKKLFEYKGAKNIKILSADSPDCWYFGYAIFGDVGEGEEIVDTGGVGIESVKEFSEIEDLRQWILYIQGESLFDPYKE